MPIYYLFLAMVLLNSNIENQNCPNGNLGILSLSNIIAQMDSGAFSFFKVKLICH
jgi:hypothetical protein